MNKVARVDAPFWVMKICATTLGETAGDLVSMTWNLGYATSSLLLLGGFSIALGAQLHARRFHPALYWLVILSTSTAGTTISDFMNRTLALGYATGSLILATGLAVVLIAWRSCEHSLAVDDIQTTRAESFYWIAILFSNTLGTALGDFLADDSGLGFLGGAALIGGLLALVLLATFATRLDRIALFWVAFVLTRPFGATFGDLLTKPIAMGGLDLGTLGASAVLATILALFVVYTSAADRRAEREQPVG